MNVHEFALLFERTGLANASVILAFVSSCPSSYSPVCHRQPSSPPASRHTFHIPVYFHADGLFLLPLGPARASLVRYSFRFCSKDYEDWHNSHSDHSHCTDDDDDVRLPSQSTRIMHMTLWSMSASLHSSSPSTSFAISFATVPLGLSRHHYPFRHARAPRQPDDPPAPAPVRMPFTDCAPGMLALPGLSSMQIQDEDGVKG
jgi:hypothetical protein